MKKILLVLAIIIVPQIGNAQDGLFKEFVNKMSTSFVSMEYTYSAMISGVKTVGKGHLSMQGEYYHHNGSGLELWCDGKSIWTTDPSSKEVVIESFEDSDSPYALNPALVLMSSEVKFTLVDQKKVGNGTEYRLLPKTSCGVKDFRFILSGTPSDLLLKSAVIVIEDGTAFYLTFSNVTFSSDLRGQNFFSPEGFDSTWIITDLR